MFFDGVDEHPFEISEAELKELENKYLIKEGPVDRAESPGESMVDKVDENTGPVPDESMVPTETTDGAAIQRPDEIKISKIKSKRKKQVSMSDENCLIKMDEVKAAIEELLKAQALKKESEKVSFSIKFQNSFIKLFIFS